jgi:outer membrane protein
MTTTDRFLVVVTALSAVLAPGAARAQTIRIDAGTAARMAVEASALVTAADSRLEASMDEVAAADGARLPVIGSYAALARRSAVPELMVPLGGPGSSPQTIFPNIQNTYLGELAVTQPLYAGGAISSRREAARHDSDAVSFSRQRTVIDLEYAARSAYWLAVAADAGLVSAQADERRALRLLDDARALRAAGMAVKADELAAEAQTAAARVDVIRAGTEVGDLLARLRSLLEIPAGVEIELADIGTTNLPPAPTNESDLQTDALAGRPELATLDARVAALEARARWIDAGRKPAVAIEGAWDLARPNPRYLPLEDTWNDSWSVGLMASWTLFDGSQTRSRAAAARAEADALRADREEIERQVKLEVETSRLTLIAALEAVVAADASNTAARAREAAARERYQAGLAQIWEMLDAQADLAEAERSQVRTRATAWIAAAALERAVGR